MNRNVERGKSAEREIATRLAELTGWRVRRRLRTGRMDDAGDLEGLPQTCAQVKSYPHEPLRAQREALDALPAQQRESGCPFAVAFIKHRGGRWVAVMTPEMFVTLLREATCPDTSPPPSSASTTTSEQSP